MLHLDTPVTNEPSFGEIADALGLGLPYRIRVDRDGRGGRFLSIGARCLEMIGVPAEVVLDDVRAFMGRIDPHDRVRVRDESAQALAARRAFSIEVRMRGPHGEERWRRITSAPRVASDGEIEWDGLVVDITDTRRLADQLAEERRRLEQAFELTGMGIYEWDRRDPEVLELSEQQYAIYGLPPYMPLDVDAVLSMVHPDDRALVREASRRAFEAPDGGDCAFEHRIRRPDGKVRWVLQHQRIRRDARGLKSIYGAMVDVTERRNAEEQRRLQVGELAHRSKNALAVLTAMVSQAGRDTTSVDELVQVLMSRIGAMAKSQDLATASDGKPLLLGTLIRQVLEAFDLGRFDLTPELEALTIPGEAVIGMALLLHELATNALKYGALCNKTGRVSLTSSYDDADGHLMLVWREYGGPPVATPERRGFGARLLAAVLQGVGGRVTPEFASAGFTARIEIPAA